MMKISLIEFNNLLSHGKYIFHLHTNYSDGLSTVEDYFEYALDNNFKTIIFTEHVRKRMSYDFDNYLSDVQRVGKIFPEIKTIVGVEAKILSDGSLDIPKDILSKIQMVCIACHSFPNNIKLYEASLKKIFTDKKWKSHMRVWVHPGRFLKKYRLLEKNLIVLEELINIAVSEGVFIEKNLRDLLPPSSIIVKIPSKSLILGYDAHSINDFSQQKEKLQSNA